MGRAVCVDVTPVEKFETQYGSKEGFRFVFEIDQKMPSGEPFILRGQRMALILSPKSSLTKFMKDWWGRAMTDAEADDFDTEHCIGRPATIVAVQEEKDGQVYTNIKSILPHDPKQHGEPLKPHGKYVRVKDRDEKTGTYQRAEQPTGGNSKENDFLTLKVHGGKYAGMELRDLSPEKIKTLTDKWLPEAKLKEKKTADDKRLIDALEWILKRESEPEPIDDDVPF